jgi:hypothetical protein
MQCSKRQLYSITSSATESSDGGTVRPSIRAVTAVDDQLELARLYDRQVRRLGVLEDAAGIDANLTKRFRNVDSVAHQPTDFDSFTQRVGRRDLVERRQVDQLDTPAGEKCVIANEQGVRPLAHESCEGRFDLRTGAGFENLDLQCHGASSRFRVSQRGLCIRGIGRIDKHGNASGSRHKLAQESQSLCGQLANEKVNACQVAARPAEAGHKTKP